MEKELAQLKERLLDIFDHLHTHPEVSWKEYKTCDFIKKQLEAGGCRVETFEDIPGVIGEIGSGKPVVALRADMDALWQEVEGEFKANHSCGHDAHMTMALGVMMLLKEIDFAPAGTLRFIFQPAEEKGQGAIAMTEKGVVDDVDYLYGVHLRPVQETQMGKAAPAIMHGASMIIEGEIHGQDAHGARPHLGTNAIEVGASLVHELGQIHLDPMVPHTVKMTKFISGGDSANIIPGHAEFSLDLRAQTNEVMDQLVEEIKRAAQALSDFYDVKIELDVPLKLAAAKVDEEAKDLMAEAIAAVLGEKNLEEPLATTGGEDFHFYTLKRRHLKSTMLGLGCDLAPGLHHPQMTFNHDALFSGVEILAAVIRKTFEKLTAGGEK